MFSPTAEPVLIVTVDQEKTKRVEFLCALFAATIALCRVGHKTVCSHFRNNDPLVFRRIRRPDAVIRLALQKVVSTARAGPPPPPSLQHQDSPDDYLLLSWLDLAHWRSPFEHHDF